MSQPYMEGLKPLDRATPQERLEARVGLKAVRNTFVGALPPERRQEARQALGLAIHDILNMTDLELSDAPAVLETWLNLNSPDEHSG